MSATLDLPISEGLRPAEKQDYLETKGRLLEAMMDSYSDNPTMARCLVLQ